MTSTYAGHYTEPPRDGTGRPIPNATFQLYVPGTKTSPVYYTNRLKEDTVSGDPSSDKYGNVDIWPEPGVYEYWYDNELIQLDTVEEDNQEDNASLAVAIAALQAQLVLMPTIEEMNDAIAAGGGPVVGGELQVNKGAENGYAPLVDFVVPDENLPTSATTGLRTPSAHASTHNIGGADPLPTGKLTSSHIVPVDDDYTAAYGEIVLVDCSTTNPVITLPEPADDVPMITVAFLPGQSDALASIVGDFDIGGTPSTDTIVLALYESPFEKSKTFSSSVNGWVLTAVVPNQDVYFNLFASQDGDGLTPLTGFKTLSEVCTGAFVPGADEAIGNSASFRTYRCTNSAGATVQLGNTASENVDVEFIDDCDSGRLHFVGVDGATIEEPDGFDYSAKKGARVSAKVKSNVDDISAVWLLGGYTGDGT